MKSPATSAPSVQAPQPNPTRARLALWTIRLSALWVLTVASIKLFKGSPSDLPLMVQNFMGWMDVGLKFQLVVAIELSVVFLAFLRPRWAWPLLAGMFTLFVAMLGKMMADGADSCGCFGGAIKISPAVMLALDGTCLLAILATRPWSSLAPSPVRWLLLLAALAVAWSAPFVAFKNQQLPTVPPPVQQGVAWQLPFPMPEFQTINPRKQAWQGKNLKETPLGVLLDVDLFPQDATWILYRITCEHCAKELMEIANDPELAAKLYVLVRIPEPNEEDYRQVNIYPPIMQEAKLPTLARGYFGQTPWTLEVEGGVIQSVTAGEGVAD